MAVIYDIIIIINAIIIITIIIDQNHREHLPAYMSYRSERRLNEIQVR